MLLLIDDKIFGLNYTELGFRKATLAPLAGLLLPGALAVALVLRAVAGAAADDYRVVQVLLALVKGLLAVLVVPAVVRQTRIQRHISAVLQHRAAIGVADDHLTAHEERAADRLLVAGIVEPDRGGVLRKLRRCEILDLLIELLLHPI